MNTVTIENQWFRAAILPEIGAKIFSLVWKPLGRELLWQNPRIPPQPYPVDANFDNYWCGGWDDAFPTCEESVHAGERYPNLGELRSVRWSVDSREGHAATLSAFGPISPVRAVKIVDLAPRLPVLKMRYEIENLGVRPIDFLWGTHPALAAKAGMTLRIPARTGIVGQVSDERYGTPGARYPWPVVSGTDVSRVLAMDAGVLCGHYVTDLEAGWYAVEDSGFGVLVRFPEKICPYLWMWLNYGGWRGYHHVIIEPWTSHPVTLADAVRAGTARRLEPGARFTAEVAVTAYAAPETWQQAVERVSRP